MSFQRYFTPFVCGFFRISPDEMMLREWPKTNNTCNKIEKHTCAIIAMASVAMFCLLVVLLLLIARLSAGGFCFAKQQTVGGEGQILFFAFLWLACLQCHCVGWWCSVYVDGSLWPLDSWTHPLRLVVYLFQTAMSQEPTWASKGSQPWARDDWWSDAMVHHASLQTVSSPKGQ